MKIFSILLLCSFVLASCADKIDTPTTANITPGMIAYTHLNFNAKDDVPFITIIDTAGKEQTHFGGGARTYYLFSASAGKILYAYGDTNRGSIGKLAIANNDNSSAKDVLTLGANEDGDGYSPVLSRDGSKFAIATRDTAANYNLWLINSDGSNKRLISTKYKRETIPSFSDDGSLLVYYTTENTIEAANTATTAITTICTVTSVGSDGSGVIAWRHGYIQFTYTDDGNIYLIAPIDPATKQLLVSGGSPCWTEDGATLAYGNGNDIYTTSDMGLTAEAITNGGLTKSRLPRWSPDGKKILCMSYVGNFDQSLVSLKLIDVASKQSTILATPGVYGFFLK